MEKWGALLLVLLAGLGTGAQPSINSSLGKLVGVLESAFISVIITAVALGLAMFFWGKGELANLAAAQPYHYLGGIIGAVFLVATIIAVPRLGAMTSMAVLITGQLLTVIVIDHFGLFGAPRIPIDPARVVGLLLLAGGLKLIFR